MFQMWYQVMYYRRGEWRVFGGWDNPIKTYNTVNAKGLAEEVLNLEGSEAAMVIRVTKAPYQDVVTRAMMTATTYEGII